MPSTCLTCLSEVHTTSSVVKSQSKIMAMSTPEITCLGRKRSNKSVFNVAHFIILFDLQNISHFIDVDVTHKSVGI